MKTIINKKGNIGFNVRPHNFTGDSLGFSIRDRIEKSGGKVKFSVSKYVVRSCGKKQLRVELLSDEAGLNIFDTMNFHPSTKLYESVTDAEIIAREMFDRLPDAEGLGFEIVYC